MGGKSVKRNVASVVRERQEYIWFERAEIIYFFGMISEDRRECSSLPLSEIMN